MSRTFPTPLTASFAALMLTAACTTTEMNGARSLTTPQQSLSAAPLLNEKFEQDRSAILAMAGDYRVTFDFQETVSMQKGYELKDRKLSGGDEVVRVIEDRGNFVSLQHILVVGGEQKFPVKHWRQDWIYEPEKVLTFIGGNAWEMRTVPEEERKGQWAQIVYQVDDSPRYGAVGTWDHDNGVSQWTPPHEWRPLPRRDMTTRDDYHAVDALNRHTITPFGWVHEQDNTKTILSDMPQALVREIGVNTYRHFDDFEVDVAERYWSATKDYWASIRTIWAEFEAAGEPFAIALEGETTELYMPLLNLATEVEAGEKTTDQAVTEARAVITQFTTTDLPPLQDRLRETANNDEY